MEKHTIIGLKQQGHSNRKVSEVTGFNRKTVARYWNAYQEQIRQLNNGGDVRQIQEAIVSKPKYNSSNRRAVKYTKEIDELLDRILDQEAAKRHLLGSGHKQHLTHRQIHQQVRDSGHDSGLTVISAHLKEKREAKTRETFIRQEYEYGQRLEYDFGEVKLVIGNETQTCHMAVLSSPKAQFRWAYLYRNQKKEVFLDSHVRFFEMAGGVYDEVVYDNMRNVVTRFIGKNEKQLNDDLVKMSLYYGFRINVTNCFRGNEKGHVESSVKLLRNRLFAVRYRFSSFEQAQEYLAESLTQMNLDALFEEEKRYLRPYRPPLELAQILEQRVDNYSFVRCENNFYSVPEYLTGRNVLVKNYATQIVVYAQGREVCRHEKKEGFRQMSVEIHHYLDTLQRKPGALKNSVALKSKAELKAVFDHYFTGRERDFIAVLKQHPGENAAQLVSILKQAAGRHPGISTEERVTRQTRMQLQALSRLYLGKEGSDYVD